LPGHAAKPLGDSATPRETDDHPVSIDEDGHEQLRQGRAFDMFLAWIAATGLSVSESDAELLLEG
jgi:hypothetical protein